MRSVLIKKPFKYKGLTINNDVYITVNFAKKHSNISLFGRLVHNL